MDRPVDQMWEIFTDVGSWPRWNPCIAWASVRGGDLRQGARLVWLFNSIRPWYPYWLPATARIVEYERERVVTWEARIPGFRARHSYHFRPAGPDRSLFGSWEVAQGPMFRTMRGFWLAHFRYVCRASLAGARALGDGVHLHPYTGGRRRDGEGRRPIVAIPGIDGSPGSIAPIVERLAERRDVLLADYSADTNPTLETLAQEIVNVVEREATGPVDVLGQSIGTIVAAQVASSALTAPRRVDTVVLIGTFTRLRWMALRISNLFTALSPRPLFRMMAAPLMAVVCGPVGDGRRHPFLAMVRDADPDAVRRRTAWQIGRDFTGDLAAIRQPVLIMIGADDRFVPNPTALIAQLRRVFADHPSSVVPIAGAGHVLLPSKAIDDAVREIEAFLG